MSTIQTATASMLIRKPIEEVYNAFVNPTTTTKFWFTQSSAPLAVEQSTTWTWDMYNLHVPVRTIELIENKRIVIEWGEGQNLSKVTWDFQNINSDSTYVKIINSDFKGEGEELIKSIIDSTGGFTMVLAGAKAWLEYGIELNLVGDKYPKEIQ